jgi:putative solute:sodium symporter small subunit
MASGCSDRAIRISVASAAGLGLIRMSRKQAGENMHEEARQTHRKRSIVLALVALAIWAVFSFFLPWASAGSTMVLFGLPLRTALAVPVALPIFVLTMFWFAGRQSAEDEQFPEDD